MDIYEGMVARTIPLAQCKSTPMDGEVMVSTVKGIHLVQISIPPRFLVPWELEVKSDVVVIEGPWLGLGGTVVERNGDSYIVRFTVKDDAGEDSWDVDFERNQLAHLEPLRK